MQLINFSIILFCTFIMNPLNAQFKKDTFVCYGKFPVSKVKGYKYVIIEPANFNKEDIATLKSNNHYVLAYVSLGEVNIHANHFKSVKPFVLEENKTWNSYTLDISNEITHDVLLNIVNEKINTGYDGFFLDNIDSYTEYGNIHHLKDNLVCFLKMIKTLYPSVFLMQNAGLTLINETKDTVNAVAVESVASDYQFSTKVYKLREYNDFLNRINTIKSIQKSTNLPFVFIEYSDNEKLSKLITKRLRKKIKPTKNSIFTNDINLQSIPKQ